MRFLRIALSCLCLGCVTMLGSQALGWHGIVLLQSTRSDVERLLGPPAEPKGSQYRTKTEIVNVRYSGEPCVKDDPSGYNIPAGVVIHLVIFPKREQRFSNLNIDETKFKKEQDPHMPAGYFHYTNYEDGMTVTVSEGIVKKVTYWPSSKFQHLRCQKS